MIVHDYVSLLNFSFQVLTFVAVFLSLNRSFVVERNICARVCNRGTSFGQCM